MGIMSREIRMQVYSWAFAVITLLANAIFGWCGIQLPPFLSFLIKYDSKFRILLHQIT